MLCSMRRLTTLLMTASVGAAGVGAALASGQDEEPTPKPTLEDCVRAWNADSVAGAVGAPVWRSLKHFVVATHDAEGRCVIAFDTSACGGSSTHAAAWVLVDGQWRPSPRPSGPGVDDRRVWMKRIQSAPNARLLSEKGRVALRRAGETRDPVTGLPI